ncbi:MAG: hypothetical protein IPL32_10205 [Chloracidobacterium sp.]|nr:hypothetical protein [Chloracidobacterium sp.]
MTQKISHDANTDTTEFSSTNEPITKKTRERRGKFELWLGEASPELTWNWDYQRYIYKKLAAVTSGKCKRLMVFMPPRHGKTELITVRYTAWRLLQDQRLNVILGSYNQKLADRFSRWVKRIVQTAAQPDRSAEMLSLSEDAHESSGGCSSDEGIAPDQLSETDGKAEPFRSASGQNPKGGLLNTTSEWETPGGGVVRAVGVAAVLRGLVRGLLSSTIR